MMRAFVQIRTDIGTTDCRPVVGRGRAQPDDITALRGLLEPGEEILSFPIDGEPPTGSTPPGAALDAWERVSYDPLANAYKPRPELTAPTQNPVPLSGYPAGTKVTVTNEAGDSLVILDLSLPLTLIDPGVYTLRFEPPFPWLPLTTTMKV